ncbi:MAG: hypothetical protein WAK34_10220 [Rhodoplanes sp.]
MVIDRHTTKSILDLNLGTGVPMVYHFNPDIRSLRNSISRRSACAAFPSHDGGKARHPIDRLFAIGRA